MSRPWPNGPRGGRPRCSWRGCPCRTGRTPARSWPGSPATTASSWTISPRRCWRDSPPTCGTSCSRRPSSSGSPVRCATPSPGRPGVRRGWSRSSGPTCSSSRSTTTGSGIATTTCSPTCFALSCSGSSRPWSPSCTGGPAPGSRSTGIRPPPSATPWPATTTSGPRTSSSSPCRRWPASGGRPSSPAGCGSCPTRWCGSDRCSESRSSARSRRCPTSPLSTSDCPISSVRCPGTVAPGRSGRRRGWSSSTRTATGRFPRASRCTGPLSRSGTASWTRPSPTPARPCHWRRRATTSSAPLPVRSAGLASWTTGDLAGAHAAYTESIAGLAQAGFVADVLGCSITLGDIRSTQGRIGDALRTYERALDLAAAEPGAPLRGTADMHVGIAAVLLERDDLAAAAEHLAVSQRLGEHKGLPQNPYRERLVAGPVAGGRGRPRRGARAARRGRPGLQRRLLPERAARPCLRTRLRLRRHELGHANAWARERQLSARDELTYLREYEHVTLARLLLARSADRIATGPRRRRRAAGPPARRRRGWPARRYRHRDAAAAGARPAGRRRSGRRARRARPRGHARRARGLRAAVRRRGATDGLAAPPARQGRSRPASGTCGGCWPPHGRPDRAAAGQPLVEPLSERELDVLRLLASDLDGPDIARELTVSLNTLRTHTKRIYAKLGVTSRRAAVQRAQALQLLPGGRR